MASSRGSPVLPSQRGKGPRGSMKTPRSNATGSEASTQGPEQLVGMLEVQLARSNWGVLLHLMHLANFMAHCKPYTAHQLADAGAARVLLDVIRTVLGADEGASATELLLGEASELLSVIAQTDAAACARHVLSREGVSLLLLVMGSPTSGTLARQQIVRLLRRFVSAGSVYREQLLAHGALPTLPLVLHDPVAACDLAFMQEVLWCISSLVESELALEGRITSAPGLLSTLVPLLQLLQLPDTQHLTHTSALIIRVLHVMVAGDDMVKDQLRQLGILDLLVSLLQVHAAAQDPAHAKQQPSAASPAGPAGGVNSGRNSARLVGPSGQVITPWDRLLAACLMEVILGGATAGAPGAVASAVLSVQSALEPGGGQLQDQHSQVNGQHQQQQQKSSVQGSAINSNSLPVSSLVRFGLLLPLLAQSGDETAPQVSHGPGEPSTSSESEASAEPPARLSLVNEAVGALAALMEDCPSNTARAVEVGVVPALCQLVSHGDMELAWHACVTLGVVASTEHRGTLVANGVVEEVVYLLQEAADALHLLTVRRQLEEHAISGTAPSLPAPHSAYAYQGRARQPFASKRVHLVGRLQLSYSASACMYASHASNVMCDYCIPSACIKTLLRLMEYNSPSAAAAAAAAAKTASGGGATDAAGPPVSHRFVEAGGLYALFLLLHHELRGSHHSKMASSLVTLLNLVLAAEPGLQDEVRKVGGLSILTTLLDSASRATGVTDIYQLRVKVCLALQRCLQGNPANQLLARENGLLEPVVSLLRSACEAVHSQVLDDDEQVTASTLDLLSATIQGSPGNQEAMVQAGGLRLLHQLILKDKPSAVVLVAAIRAMGFLVEGSDAAQKALMGAGLLARMVSLADAQPDSELAQSVVYTCCQLIRANPGGKQVVLDAKLVPVLLRMLGLPSGGPSVAAACHGLYAVSYGDTDMQNEVAGNGALHAIHYLVHGRGPFAVHAVWLLCCLLHGNTYVKNAARQSGFPALLVKSARRAGLVNPDLMVGAMHALCQLCQSNHSNQEAAADVGGIELVCDVLRMMVLSPSTLRDMAAPGKAGGPGVTPRTAAVADELIPSLEVAATAAAAAAAGTHQAGHAAPSPALAVAAAFPSVVDAALRFLGSLLEFNATNQKLARETGCLSLLAQLLLIAAELPDLGTLRAAHLLPGVAAACAAIANAAQDCEDNQARLVTGHEDLAPALFRLLTIDEPYVAMEAARALEFMVIRSDLVHDVGEERGEFEADAMRSLVRVLHARGGSKQAPGASSLIPNGKDANGQSYGDALGTSGTSATVKEAAATITAIVEALAPSNTDGKASANGGATPGAGSKLGWIWRTSAAPTANAPKQPIVIGAGKPIPVPPPAQQANGVSDQQQQQQQHPSATQQQGQGQGQSDQQQQRAQPPPSIRSHPPPLVPLASTFIGQQSAGRGPSTGGTFTPTHANTDHTPFSPPPPMLPRDLALMQPLQASFAGAEPASGSLGSVKKSLPHSGSMEVSEIGTDPGGYPGASLKSDQWTWLAGKSAASFQAVARTISDGPWRPVKTQLAWVLYLLAAKSAGNRELLLRLERTVVTPLAQQLANVEAFYASAAAAAAAVVATAGTDLSAAPGQGGSLPISTLANDSLPHQLGGTPPRSRGHSRHPSTAQAGSAPQVAVGASSTLQARPANSSPARPQQPSSNQGGPGGTSAGSQGSGLGPQGEAHTAPEPLALSGPGANPPSAFEHKLFNNSQAPQLADQEQQQQQAYRHGHSRDPSLDQGSKAGGGGSSGSQGAGAGAGGGSPDASRPAAGAGAQSHPLPFNHQQDHEGLSHTSEGGAASPHGRGVTSDEESDELAMIRQEAALLASLGLGGPTR